MRIERLKIYNFRGISEGIIKFKNHSLLVGENNAGKSTICEALDLVLGVERLYRKPPINEHDFFRSQYLEEDSEQISGNMALDNSDVADETEANFGSEITSENNTTKPIEIRIEVVLTDLSDEASRRFLYHLRAWNSDKYEFIDKDEETIRQSDQALDKFALPLIFIGRYDHEDDDFIGDTFFAHPAPEVDRLDDESNTKLGNGFVRFTAKDKRLCGFIYLRALRTGSRALSLQRGSLLDTILKLSPFNTAEMWEKLLMELKESSIVFADKGALKEICTEINNIIRSFLNISDKDEHTTFFVSELTREHLREALRFFIATKPDEHLLPFNKLGTGSRNILVFALLSYIAKLRGEKSVIFAMEEPEIAIPPHSQRKVTKFLLDTMGQAILTSHSPYVIEQFCPSQIVMLNRDSSGELIGKPVVAEELDIKTFMRERYQFAEAILSRAVLVVEGATEAYLFPAASKVMGKSFATDYTDFDMAGLTVFDAKGDKGVPKYGPIFSTLGKISFAFYDKQKIEFSPKAKGYLKEFEKEWESSALCIEDLIVEEMPITIIKKFLDDAKKWKDYPNSIEEYDSSMKDVEIKGIAKNILSLRKAEAKYAVSLIEYCENADELPITIRNILEEINQILSNGENKNSNELL